jgi:hypothetical protein
MENLEFTKCTAKKDCVIKKRVRRALARTARRSQLWTCARATCSDEEQFRACTIQIEQAVQKRIHTEFPPKTKDI